MIDKEMHDIVSEAYADVLRILREHIDALHHMADALIEVETINHEEVHNLVEYGTLKKTKDTQPDEAEHPDDTHHDDSSVKDEPRGEVSPWGNTIPDMKKE